MCTQQSRKVIWDMINTLFLTLSLFNLLSLLSFSIRKHTSMASCVILSNFFEEQRTQNHPQYLSGLSRALFPTTFLEIAVYRDAKRRGIYLPFFTDPKGDSCFSIYQIRWITMKKVTSLSRNFDYNLQTFRWFCQVHFYDFVANSAWIQHFLPTSKHRQAKVRRFLGFCLYEYFIYRSHFVFRQCLETRRHLGSGRKTVNSHRYSELRESIKTRENCYSLIW